MSAGDTAYEQDEWLLSRYNRTVEFVNVDLLNLRIAMWALVHRVSESGPSEVEKTKPGMEQALDWAVNRGKQRVSLHIAIGLWSALEVHVEDLFVYLCTHDRSPVSAEHFGGLRVRVSEFMPLDEDERWRLIWNRSETPPGKRGVDRYDALFERHGVKVDSEADARSSLYELQMVRNVIVHRGKVDQRLQEIAGGRFHAGDDIELPDDALLEYGQAVLAYTSAVSRAVEVALTADPDDDEGGMQGLG
jgi:hypothetical protein